MSAPSKVKHYSARESGIVAPQAAAGEDLVTRIEPESDTAAEFGAAADIFRECVRSFQPDVIINAVGSVDLL